MTERMPSSPRTPEPAPILREEVILTDFRDTVHEPHEIHNKEERAHRYHTFHDYLERLENPSIINQYENGTVPTLESLQEATTAAAQELEADPDDQEGVRMAKLLRGQVQSIRLWCRRYVGSVIAFHTLRRKHILLNSTDTKEDFFRADSERRRIHNALLDSLRTCTALIQQTAAHAGSATPILWEPTMTLPKGTASSTPVAFSANTLEDRDLVKQWAIAADCVEEMKKVLGADDFPPS